MTTQTTSSLAPKLDIQSLFGLPSGTVSKYTAEPDGRWCW
jgi:hypothetical protein